MVRDTRIEWWAGDVIVAAVAVLVCAAPGLLGGTEWQWSVLMAALLIVRRTRPVVFAVLAAAVSVAHLLLNGGLLLPGDAVLLVAVFSVAAHAPEQARTIGLFLGIGYAVSLGGWALVGASSSLGAASPIVGLVASSMVVAWALGLLERRKVEALRAARHRHELSERTVAIRSRLAAYEERERISAEMHDVLAHTLTSVVVQAESGRADTSDPRAADVFETISATSRSALREIRGLLSAEIASAALPTPGIDDLAELVEGFAKSGMTVTLHVVGVSQPLTPELSLSVYRVVQESLTNALRHGSGDQAWVGVAWAEGTLTVVTTNPIASAPAAPLREQRGITGMRRRCELYGGSVCYSHGDVFVITACWPLRAGVDGASA
ncbi:two-component sensor histidine kinase [Rathayibacter tritici]|uniref:histidine kinase n=1 Tax=Rathayibacter tritici TaxID=33888 RepID=A0A160KUI7_9MICO|nr:two-component sensor histidine kinase [Rathayibacter tritici]